MDLLTGFWASPEHQTLSVWFMYASILGTLDYDYPDSNGWPSLICRPNPETDELQWKDWGGKR